MGISANPIGKEKSILVKLDNRLSGEKKPASKKHKADKKAADKA